MENWKASSVQRASHCTAFVLVSLLVFSNVDCYSAPTSLGTSSPASAHSSLSRAGQGETTALPTVLSQLDGWRGVRLVRSYRGSTSYCSFEFPRRFGLQNDDERKLILGLTRDRFRFIKVQDIGDCRVSYLSAFKQLFLLATEFQDADAARWFVMPKGGYDGLNLDGEWAETYNIEFRPKVLMSFNNLLRIIPATEEPILAEEICAVASSAAEAYLDGAGIKPVIQSLQRKGMNSLAKKLLDECGQN